MTTPSQMRIFTGQPTLPEEARGAVFALGNFDGVHPGHRAVIEVAAKEARRLNTRLGVVTFEPLSRQYFRPDGEPMRLTTSNQRRMVLAELGVEILAELTFDQALAQQTDREFCEIVLAKALGARAIVVGYDFCFGRGRTGTPEILRRFGQDFGFEVAITAPVTVCDGHKASSSKIREALKSGDVGLAAQLLGRPWEIEGLVEQGEQRGRTIGFPTANVRLGPLIHPRFGVYAVMAAGEDGVWRPGVANFGRTPTTGLRDPLLEVHLFDFKGDLYGQTLRTQLIGYIRDELKFDGLQALIDEMHKDSATARTMLAAHAAA